MDASSPSGYGIDSSEFFDERLIPNIIDGYSAVCYFNGWGDVGAVAIVGSLADIIFSGLGNMSYQVSSMKSVQPIFGKFDQLTREEVTPILSTSDSTLYKARNVAFSYGQEVIFSDVSFDIQVGEKSLIKGVGGAVRVPCCDCC